LRADAERNRARLLDAAAAAFAESGLEVSVAEIARRAGVGQGTVFRRFPTKADLVAAVLTDRLAALRDHAHAAVEHQDPWEGLRAFMIAGAEMKARDRGFFEEAAAGEALRDPAVREFHAEIGELMTRMLDRAQAAGAVRADITAQDIHALIGGAVKAGEPWQPVVPGLWRRYLEVILAGLRPGDASTLPVPPPTVEQLYAAVDRCTGASPDARP
jgi:AcrR family transcriptional regulator